MIIFELNVKSQRFLKSVTQQLSGLILYIASTLGNVVI